MNSSKAPRQKRPNFAQTEWQKCSRSNWSTSVKPEINRLNNHDKIRTSYYHLCIYLDRIYLRNQLHGSLAEIPRTRDYHSIGPGHWPAGIQDPTQGGMGFNAGHAGSSFR